MPSKKTQKKTRKRIAKEHRKNLRLWAEGIRDSILRPHIPRYGDALERGWRAERECLQDICNKFHTKISWKLQDHEEPELPLAEYDPLAPAEEEDDDDDEAIAKRERIEMLNKRIRNWLKYRVRRLRKLLRTKLDPRKDPWAVLLAQLSNIRAPPKARQAYQQFFREQNTEKIAPVVAQRWAERCAAGSNLRDGKGPDAAFRAEIARELFAALPEEERAEYAKTAREEAAAARDKYFADLKAPPSKSAEDRHANVGEFMAPILQGIHERTGLHSVLLMGGPIPEYGGELKSVYVSYGRSLTGGTHFPEWLKGRWNIVLDLMGEYLQTAFTKRDQQEAALPESADALAGAKYRMDDDNADSDGASDSESGSSDTDSNADSDDSDVPARAEKMKKRVGKKSGANAGAPGQGSKGKGKAVTQEEGGEDGEAATDGGEKRKKRKEPAEKGKGERGEKRQAATQEVGEGGSPVKKRKAVPKPKAQSTAGRKRAGEGAEEEALRKRRKVVHRSEEEDSDGDDEGDDEREEGPSSQGGTATRHSGRLASGSKKGQTVTSNTQGAATDAETPPAAVESHVEGSVAAPARELTPPPTPQPSPQEPVNPPRTGWMPAGAAPSPSTSTLNALPQLSTAPPAPNPPSPPSIPIIVPAKAPAWLASSVEDLTRVDLGCHYTSVVAALIRLETAAKYGNNNEGRLPAAQKGLSARPKVISAWIRGGRGTRSKVAPTVGNVAAFVTEWDGWWDAMQPEWRERNRQGRWRVDPPHRKEGDCGVLETYGINGILSVVAGIYFWGVAVVSGGDEEQTARWDNAVQDVSVSKQKTSCWGEHKADVPGPEGQRAPVEAGAANVARMTYSTIIATYAAGGEDTCTSNIAASGTIGGWRYAKAVLGSRRFI
ncbi:hypothetical protein C8F04DRAFT_1278922 [Mycena alexandri]|uniref:Uncharacterized protein n=1 Tax=Mycena alexandri TaxID=1745969 RepID=A0AAD6S0N1_9AGAR|nr:hypothetical protein C8F04DRAFT_1278922 [Mycena alexandri]